MHDVAGAPGSPEPAVLTAAGAAGRFVVPGITPEESRIVAPGEPRNSALLHRMKSRRPASQMPPLGTMMPDHEAIELVRRWIESLQKVDGRPQGESRHPESASGARGVN